MKSMEAKLFKNTQFIYELELAKLEMESFNIDYDMIDGLRIFNINDLSNGEFIKRTAYFRDIDGELSDYYYIQKYNQTKSVNQYLTHWFYPYKGKFHPQMVRSLCNIIGLKKGDKLLDPFIGSGTTAIEAKLLGIDMVGYDISPLCVLISEIKANSMNYIDEIESLKTEIFPIAKGLKVKQNDFFGKYRYSDIEIKTVGDFYKVAEMIAHSDNKRRNKDFFTSFYNNIEKMILSVRDFRNVVDKLKINIGETKIKEGDARNLVLCDNSIDGIITSPPYSIALNYIKNDEHALNAMDINVNEIVNDFIGIRGNGIKKFRLYYEDMKKCLEEMYRVLNKDKYCVIIIGNVKYKGKEIDTSKWFKRSCQDIGFEFVKEIDKIIFGLYNVMQEEFIQIYKK